MRVSLVIQSLGLKWSPVYATDCRAVNDHRTELPLGVLLITYYGPQNTAENNRSHVQHRVSRLGTGIMLTVGAESYEKTAENSTYGQIFQNPLNSYGV